MGPRRSAATEVVDEEESPQLAALQFNEPLSWRVGKAIQTAELLKRLEKLAAELREMEQGEVDKNSLTKVAKELVGQNLINHRDKGVKAFTACCLVDVLKLCAPDAPFTGTQLKDIFTLFVTTILPALSDPSNAYNTQHAYVLISLAEVKSIVLLTDLSNSEDLMLHLFATFFDMISGTSKSSTGEQLSKNVEYHMNGILVTLVDEAPALPTAVIDVIVAQFLRAASLGANKSKQNGHKIVDEKQTTLLMKEYPPAYRMAEFICNTCSEKMARYVSQYFNDVILEASDAAGKTSKSSDHRRSSINYESEDEEGRSPPTDAEMMELHKAHRLLRELWRASPSVLQNVIPQLEAELSAENVQLRLLATETLGDIISGIGAAGPPPPPVLDPAAYPPIYLTNYPETPVSTSILTTPMSPQSFAQSHPSVYQNFLGRYMDKAAIIRSAWTTAVGRILLTSAGGIGLSREDEIALVNGLSEKLKDADERVRIAALKAVGNFSFRDIMTKLTLSGDVGKSESALSNLFDRARDLKHAVRVEGMTTISKIWGVAAGEILSGNEIVTSMLGAIPSKIFDAFYANDLEVYVLLDHILFEQLIPLSYPPAKVKVSKQANGDSQTSQAGSDGPFNTDKIRTERILTMINSLVPKSKKAFFALQARQESYRRTLETLVSRAEEYNGGVIDDKAKEKETKDRLSSVINWIVKALPDKPRATTDLWKYVKLHDRRSYQLVRFAIALESDFKTVLKAIKEFSKRIEAAPGSSSALLETLIPILYRGSSLIYNRSHLPTIIEYSRNDGHPLSSTAHEVLNEISQRNPQIFKAQVKELCKLLQDQVPTEEKANDSGSVETLKACASYAQKYPQEILRDRKFIQALVSFAKYGEPAKAAKYAVSILIAAAERKEMHAKDLLQKSIVGWEYGSPHFLSKMAAISQLTLLEPTAIDEKAQDEILDITTQKVLLQVRTPSESSDRNWQDDAIVDDECQAKCWALKILVNRLRSIQDLEAIKAEALPVFKLLNTLVVKEGEISKSQSTPKHHKSRLRLVAAKLILKLCSRKELNDFLTPTSFNHLATVAQDSTFQVRRAFVGKLQKYLVQNRLPARFYTIVFLVAFEPDADFRLVTLTWIRSRVKIFQESKNYVMETTIARLLSLLAHHPDYSPEPSDLVDHAKYVLFYVASVANENNLGMIYRYAERVKQVRDAIKPAESENIYMLSDLAQAVIRKWQERKGWSMPTFPGKLTLSSQLFSPMPNHDVAQEVAGKQYLPEEVDELLDGLIKAADKKKNKRRLDDNDDKPIAKKPRAESVSKAARVPATKKDGVKASTQAVKKAKSKPVASLQAASAAERRRSGRVAGGKSYADRDDSEDDEEMMKGVSKWEYGDGHIERDVKDDEGTSEDVEVSGAAEESDEPEAEAQVEEADEAKEADLSPEPSPERERTPLKSKVNGRTPLRTKAVPSKAPKLALKTKSKVTPKAKSKAKVPAKSKGKGKAVAKDVYDFDDSD